MRQPNTGEDESHIMPENRAAALSPQLAFVNLPAVERQRILAQQADEMAARYEQTASDREEWQAGDFADPD